MSLLRRILVSRKYFASCSIALISVTFFTLLYISSSKNQCYNDISKLQLDHNETPLPRVLCLIITSPKNFLTFTKAVNDTWGPRCDRYFFITEYPNNNATSEQLKIAEQIPIAPIKNITPGYDHLTQKSTLAFLFAYENYFNDIDWFVKADDDTFLFVDHLKAFLSEQNTSEPVTFGYHYKVIITDPLLSA
jgi:glycoprotein-N-acetylgalactosamine 3-beta-galactosyltransferase